MGDDGENDARYAAMTEFIGSCFEDSSSSLPPPSDLSELGDGVVLFEVLSEIAPDYFDPATIARDLGDNWALKSSNLRKLLRNLETYYRDALFKTADFESVDVSAISRRGDRDAVANLVELVAGAAVSCEGRGEFVGRIMELSPESQMEMKGVIESAMSRMADVDGADGEYSDEEGGGAGGLGGAGDIHDFDSDDYETDDDDAGLAKSLGVSGLFPDHGPDVSSAAVSDALRERDELRKSLEDTQKEYAAFKSRSAVQAEDTEAAQRKLRDLAEDLQDRLGRRQEELLAAEEGMGKARRALEDSEAKVSDLKEKNAQLADELDVASAKATQLVKAEATVVAYRRKLEGVGVMSQQMNELEDQSEKYLRQIMELESDVKKLPGLQKDLEELQNQIARTEKEREEAEEAARERGAEISRLKAEATQAEEAKRHYEEELAGLRAQVGADAPEMDETGTGDSLTSSSSLAAAKEKAMRMQIENEALKEQIEQLQAQQVNAAPSAEMLEELSQLRLEVEQLREELERKEAEKAKLGSDKEKLEAYTKKTLSKFQEKYLVALQECKAKLKEKHDKIEALEQRSASEKTAQKREERLLSSTIYELGLAIMQQRLKDRG
mmetsp:Transcript_18416/g.37335  ORF Transcript_18416/g.37335 Transcript_18416/m.37335 type:complete len:611 (-) Transcript_18416:72-1904(-)